MVNACYRHQHPDAFGGEPVLMPTEAGCYYASTEEARPTGRDGVLHATDTGLDDHHAFGWQDDYQERLTRVLETVHG